MLLSEHLLQQLRQLRAPSDCSATNKTGQPDLDDVTSERMLRRDFAERIQGLTSDTRAFLSNLAHQEACALGSGGCSRCKKTGQGTARNPSDSRRDS
jgi:hypothetical protein